MNDSVKALEADLTALRSKRPLPNLIGKPKSAAESLADEFGWELDVTSQGSDAKQGTILSQTPDSGTKMKHGSQFRIVVAKPFPPGWKDIKVFSGSGEITTPEVRIPNGKVRLVYDFTGNTNAQITMYQRPNDYVELFLNEIGDYSAPTRVYYSGRYYFEICCGSWTVRVQEWR